MFLRPEHQAEQQLAARGIRVRPLQLKRLIRRRKILVHNILVEQIEPTLRIRTMDMEWLDDFLVENPEAIAHDTIEEGTRLIFTASTEELQAFMLEHIDTEGAYAETIELIRLDEEVDEIAGEEDVESAEAESD